MPVAQRRPVGRTTAEQGPAKSRGYSSADTAITSKIQFAADLTNDQI